MARLNERTLKAKEGVVEDRKNGLSRESILSKYEISETSYYRVLAMACEEQGLDHLVYLDYPNRSHFGPHGPMPESTIEHIDIEATNALFAATIKSMNEVCDLMDREVQYHKAFC